EPARHSAWLPLPSALPARHSPLPRRGAGRLGLGRASRRLPSGRRLKVSPLMSKLSVFITSPLEPEYVERIRAVDPERLNVVCEPDLWPPTRYFADHVGKPFTRNADQERRWHEALARADILFDLPRKAEDAALAKRVKWVQTTSTGVGQSVKNLGL